jgi:hypothetical protein
VMAYCLIHFVPIFMILLFILTAPSRGPCASVGNQ